MVNNELWVCLIEKVWAKIHGDYVNTEGGFMTETLHALTGAPTKWINTSDPNLWNTLIEGEKRDWVMTASSSSELGNDSNAS